MSNGRSWRRAKTGAVAAAGLSMIVAPLALSTGTASAAPVAPTVAVTAPVAVSDGATSSAPVTLTVTAGGSFAAGDVMAIDLPNGAATATQGVAFSGTPTVTVSGPPAGTTPTFTAALAHNAGDTGGFTGTDEIDLTEGATNATGGVYTVTVSGVKVTAGIATPVGPSVGATVTYKPFTGPTLGPSVPSGPVATVSDVTVAAAPIGVAPNSASVSLPNVTIAEAVPGVLTDGLYTLALTAGAFTSTPTVTSSVAGITITGISTAGGVLSFTVAGAPTTAASGPTTLTVGGITASTPGSGTISALLAGGVPAVAFPVAPTALAAVTTANSIAGADAQTTAAMIYNAEDPNPNVLVLATDSNFPDALSGAYLAGSSDGAGILLTNPDSLPPATQAIIANNLPSTIYVLGGPVAISQDVITQIQALYTSIFRQPTIIRLGGADQFGTNEDVINAVSSPDNLLNLTQAWANEGMYNDPSGTAADTGNESPATAAPAQGAPTAIVASGTSFPDALSAGPLSYDGVPIILTLGDTLSPSAQAELLGLGIKQVVVAGGPVAVSNSVVTAINGPTSSGGLGIPVLRVGGVDATDTAQLFAQFEENNAGFSASNPVYVARGDFYTDALAAAPLLAFNNAPLLLTEDPNRVGPYLTKYLNTQGSNGIFSFTQFGGPAAITPTTDTAISAALAAGA